MGFDAFLLSLISAAAAAGMALVNEWGKVSGIALLIWRGLIPALLLAPMVTLLDAWPTEPVFYGLVAASALGGAIVDGLAVVTASRYGGGVVSRLTPVSLWFVLIPWAVVAPETMLPLIEDPLHGLAVVAALGAMIWAAGRLRGSAVDWAALRLFWPAIVAAGIVQVINKLAMDGAPTFSGAMAYGAFQGALIAAGATGVMVARHGIQSLPVVVSRRVLAAGALFAGAVLIHLLSKNMAMVRINNPTWVSALLLTAPLFVLVLYRCIGRKESTDWRAGLVVVGATAVLVLAAP